MKTDKEIEEKIKYAVEQKVAEEKVKWLKEMVKQGFENGMRIDEIELMTELSVEEIEEIKKELKDFDFEGAVRWREIRRRYELERNTEIKHAEEKARAEAEAEEKARAIGRAIGRRQCDIETAKKMKEKGFDIKLISEITEFTEEEIKQIN